MKQPGLLLVQSTRRIILVVLAIIAIPALVYLLWRPGSDFTDGRNDRGSNAVWLAHGWLGADEWFTKNNKNNELANYRAPTNLFKLAEKLRRHGITDVFPHLCPAKPTGELPEVDSQQVERFLDSFDRFRVLPWIGGPNGSSVRLNSAQWRTAFVASTRSLLAKHSRLAGVHLNIEPLTSGDRDFLLLLDELRAALPDKKLVSIAAYPPPTRWHPYPDVHWDEHYFREVGRRSDQIAVMMYDIGQKLPKTYQQLMSDWAIEVLAWSEGKSILLGVPTYDDAGVGYHDPRVENLSNALLGIHHGLSTASHQSNYQGIAIYCEWETSEAEWNYLREHFLRGNDNHR